MMIPKVVCFRSQFLFRPQFIRAAGLAAGLVFSALGIFAGTSAGAGELRLNGHFTQGGLVIGYTEPDAKVRFHDRDVRVAEDGMFVIGFGYDFAEKASLQIRHADGRRELRELTITRRQYAVQRINGLAKRYVSPPKKVLKRIRRENAAIGRVRRRDSKTAWFRAGFLWPAIGPISGVYGSRRILNGQPRRPHFGVDVAAPEGTPVTAPAPGKVVMAEADLYYTGGTVMLDHGHGLTSVYSHLRDVDVKVGQVLAAGDPLGTIGATGRVTGPHLDWRVNWFKQRLDPALLAGPMPK